MFVLDGLDEADHNEIDMFINLAQSKGLHKCLFVFTSRHESGMKMRPYCDNLWEIVGFAEEDAERFIYKYFRNMEHLAERLLKEIRSRSDLRQLTSNPLNTALLCILCEDFKEAFPESRTQLYIEIVKYVLRRYEEKKGFSSNNEDLIEVYEGELRSLGRIALQSLLKGELYIEGSKVNANHFNTVKKFGFLSVQSGGSKIKPCFRYGFLHKSFQEFFAGFYLALKNVREEEEAEITLIDKRFLGELQQVLLYICGVVAMQSEETAKLLIRKITTHVNRLRAKKKVGRIIKLAFGLIEECGKCKKNLQSQLLHEFGTHLQLNACTLEMIPRLDFFLESLSCNTFLTGLDLIPISRNFEFGGLVISDKGIALLSQALSVITPLTHLNLGNNEINDSGAASLSQVISVNTSLTHLSLSGNKIGVSGAVFLSQGLKVNTTLTNLNLGHNEIDDSGAAFLSQALKVNTTLTNLNLTSTEIGASGAASLSQALSVNITLTNLDLSHDDIDDSGAASLSQALLVNTTLTDLNLTNIKVGASGAASLSQALSVNTSLTHLDLGVNRIGASGAASLSKALSVNSSLTDLNLWLNMLGASGAASLSHALSVNSSLTNLNLGGNMIDDSGATSLSRALSVNAKLTHLDLGFNWIGASGAASLSHAISVNSSLTNLNLTNNKIGSSGVASLSISLSVNQSLTNLNLCGNKIDDSGVTALSQALLANTKLTDLNLDCDTSDCFRLVDALSVNTSLAHLILNGQNIDLAGDVLMSLIDLADLDI